MLNFLRRWVFNRSRQIFRFWDGYCMRGADPIVVLRALLQDPQFDADIHVTAAEAGQLDARDITIAATRRALGVSAWSESTPGLTDMETWTLLVQFLAYCESLKKSGSLFPNLPVPTEPLPSEDAASAAGTNALSDSGSTLNESNSAAPESS